jgi:hypothetical protein
MTFPDEETTPMGVTEKALIADIIARHEKRYRRECTCPNWPREIDEACVVAGEPQPDLTGPLSWPGRVFGWIVTRIVGPPA